MKLIILDRDGVINEDSDNFIKDPSEWVPIPGSLEAISRLNQAGYSVVIATNQSGIARGLFDIRTLNDIHEKMHRALSSVGGVIPAIFFCPHGPDDNCECRKPKTGLFTQIAGRFKTGLQDVSAVGDSLRDIQSAKAVGAKPVLVRTGKGERTLSNLDAQQELKDVPVFDNLSEFVNDFLSKE
ncbi:MAG: D-glycero-beta-D-manno-heptose 1,7-bisphosphate 7-phosphatase [Gammaproteobacteria bacterium]|nr:D-glycero-beta-D-manno-heptose 1,7-bisphosphate 7-phosphatase [Gammaproteobacteria bacterium]